MSYSLYDTKGYVDDLATTTGLRELAEFARANGDRHVIAFFDLGASLITDEFVSGLVALSKKKGDPLVKNTLDDLIEAVGRCNLVAIISDGVNDNL